MEFIVHVHVTKYRVVRDRFRAAVLRGDDTDTIETELDSLWIKLSPADRRTVLGIEGREEKPAAA